MTAASPLITDIMTRLAWDMDVVGSSHLSVILFYSCISSPSIVMIETFAQVAPQHTTARFFTVDVDKNSEITWQFRVSIVPTIMMFQRGQKLHEMITLKSAAQINAAIVPYLG